MSSPVSALSSFASLGVPTRLIDPLFHAGISTPFPIQSATLPDTLAGRDVLGRGRSGSGKTLAFSLPLVARLAGLVPSGAKLQRQSRPGAPRGLVLAPTRELANQILATIEPLAASAGLGVMTIFGGVSQAGQVRRLSQRVDIVVATPGRLEDLIGQGHLRLDDVVGHGEGRLPQAQLVDAAALGGQRAAAFVDGEGGAGAEAPHAGVQVDVRAVVRAHGRLPGSARACDAAGAGVNRATCRSRRDSDSGPSAKKVKNAP